MNATFLTSHIYHCRAALVNQLAHVKRFAFDEDVALERVTDTKLRLFGFYHLEAFVLLQFHHTPAVGLPSQYYLLACLQVLRTQVA